MQNLPNPNAILIMDKTKKSSSAGITLPVVTFGSFGLICIFIFMMVRGRLKDIYMPRRILKKGRPPPLPGVFSWISVVYRTDEAFLVNTVGVDGVMLLRFLKMGYQLFFILSLLGLFVLAPINYHSTPPTFPQGATYFEFEAILLPSLTIDNIQNAGSGYVLWLLLVFVWIICFITFVFVLRFYRSFIELKLHYDEFALTRTRMSKVEMRTCFLIGVPRDLRSEVDLTVYIENLGVGKVENVVLVRNWSQLQTAVQQRGVYLEKLEKLYTLTERYPFLNTPPVQDFFPVRVSDSEIIVQEIEKRFRNIPRPVHYTGFLGFFGERVDSLDYYCKLFREWDAKVQRLRKTPERSAATHVAFVTFQSPMSATLLSQCVVHSNTFNMIARMAPEPRDVFWQNLSSKSAHRYSKLLRSFVAAAIMIFLITSSTIVVSSLAALMDLEQLALEFPFLEFIKEIPPTWRQFIQGIIPPSLLALWNSLLPSILLILCHLQGLEAESWIQASLLSKYFNYQIWNVIIVIPLANTIVWKILVNPQKVIERLGEMLPKASTTLLNLIILQGLAIFPAQLLLVSPLFFITITRLFYTSTERQQSNSYYPSMLTFAIVNYGYIYPVPILVFVIGLCYSIISPIILPFCCLFFAIGYFVMKYLMMYVHFPDYESKGLAITFVVNRCLDGLVLMQFTVMGVLALKAADMDDDQTSGWSQYAQMVIGVLPLPIITLFLYTLVNQAAKRQIRNIPIEIIGKVQRYFSKLVKERRGQRLESFDAQQEETRLLNRLSVIGRGEHVFDEPHHHESEFKPKFGLSPFQNPEDDNNPSLEIVQQHNSYDLIEEDDTEEDLISSHLEPPMTRCPGILNIPVGGSMLRHGEQDLLDGLYEDGQLHTYYHPALIGKLPVAWLKGQPFHELRQNQDREQKILMGRLISQQRLAVDEDIRDEEEESRIRSFFDIVDGITSFVHLSLF